MRGGAASGLGEGRAGERLLSSVVLAPLQGGGRRFDPGWLHDEADSLRTAGTRKVGFDLIACIPAGRE